METFNLNALSAEEKALYYRFISVVEKRGRVNTNMSPCWTHTTGKSSSGYGQICLSGVRWNLHRYSYWIHNNKPELKKGHHIAHSCDNKDCSNPEHLSEKTSKENAIEAVERIRTIKPKKEVKEGNWSHINQLGDQSGENNQTAILTWEKVREIRKKKEAGLKYGELKKMAEHYGIAYITIQKIVAGSLWKE
jgi:hypothetical protein